MELPTGQEREQALAKALDRAGATPRLLRMTLASHPDEAARAFAGRWLENYRAGEIASVWLSGPVGTGKTGLAWGIVRALTLDAIDAFYATDYDLRPDDPRGIALFLIWRDLLDELRVAFGNETAADADPNALLRRARRIPVLALDDLGSERPTRYALEQLAILVDQRYNRELPTIVTSNYAARDLAKVFGSEDKVTGGRILSRLIHGGVAHVFDGPSLRRAAG